LFDKTYTNDEQELNQIAEALGNRFEGFFIFEVNE